MVQRRQNEVVEVDPHSAAPVRLVAMCVLTSVPRVTARERPDPVRSPQPRGIPEEVEDRGDPGRIRREEPQHQREEGDVAEVFHPLLDL